MARSAYLKPGEPACLNQIGAETAVTRSNEKTDLTAVVCVGPVDRQDAAYAQLFDCVSDKGTDSVADLRRVSCGDPTATLQVVERHESDDNACPPNTAVRLRFGPGVTAGATICLRHV
ncbi:hypothetical protein ACFXHA_36480 [Nocardia sp. NPDC059240]|uniref:LppU/SCO3897 family protein n=1 Tax=Nocardia sp. NPDC059240 TaxID=3346786 RepID=UPI00368AD737